MQAIAILMAAVAPGRSKAFRAVAAVGRLVKVVAGEGELVRLAQGEVIKGELDRALAERKLTKAVTDVATAPMAGRNNRR